MNDLLYLSFKMKDVILSAMVTFNVPFMNRIQHWRTRCKIKRDIIAEISPRSQINIPATPMFFDMLMRNSHGRNFARIHFSVTPQPPSLNNTWQIVYMSNVINVCHS